MNRGRLFELAVAGTVAAGINYLMPDEYCFHTLVGLGGLYALGKSRPINGPLMNFLEKQYNSNLEKISDSSERTNER